MKSKKGETVEVFSKRGEQAFSWWTAKIVSSQGASHMVSYNYKFDEDLGVNLEQVPAQAVRPYPPFIYKPTWVVGDIVEVFDDHSWKLAEIMKIVRSDYIVRFLGLEKERKVHWYDIRIRLSWENGEWLVIKQEFTTKRCTQMCADGCNKTISSHEEVAVDELLKYSTTGIRYCHDVSAFSESNDRESVGSCDIDDSCAAGDEISSRINDGHAWRL